MNDWKKPRTVFASFFYYTFLLQTSCGIKPHPLLLKIVGGLFLLNYGEKAVKTLLQLKGQNNA